MFQVGLPCYLGLNSAQSLSINVDKTRKYLSRNIHGANIFPQRFPVSHTGNIVSSVSFCFQDANYAYATRQGILTKIRTWRAPAKVLRAGASEQLSNFCQQFEQRLNFASFFKWDGPIQYPFFVGTPKTTQTGNWNPKNWRLRYACSNFAHSIKQPNSFNSFRITA